MKNTDTAKQKGYDAGKKVSGIKRHIAVHTQGLPHAVAVTTAEVTDRNGALAAFDRCAVHLKQVTSVLVDGGYSGKPFAEAVQNKLGPPCRSPNAMSCIPSPSCRSGGSSNDPSLGWKNVEDSGKTANDPSTPAFK